MNYLLMFLSALLGLAGFSVWKINKVQSRYENESFQSVLGIFIKKEMWTTLMSVIAILICLVVTADAFNLRKNGIPLPGAPAYMNEHWPLFINTVFCGIGIVGGLVLYSGLNLTEKYVQKKTKEIGDSFSQ